MPCECGESLLRPRADATMAVAMFDRCFRRTGAPHCRQMAPFLCRPV